MSQRRRRATHCRVEELEGRAAPSIFTYTAKILPREPKTLEISGETLSPTVAGNRLVISVVYYRPTDPKKEYTSVGRDTVRASNTGLKSVTGIFSATVRCELPSWHTVKPLEITFSSYNATTNRAIESETHVTTEF